MSTFPDRLLSKLKEAQTTHALDYLSTPITKDAFEYGQRCGVIFGLKKAETILLDMLDEDKKDDSDL